MIGRGLSPCVPVLCLLACGLAHLSAPMSALADTRAVLVAVDRYKRADISPTIPPT